MAHVQRAIRLIFFTAWAVFMTALTYVLGAPSLKVLRRRLGRTQYWAFNTLISMGLYAAQAKMLAVAYFSLVILMGVLEEFEEMGFSLVVGAFFTLLINSLISAGAFALWVSATGPNWSQVILSWLELALKPLTDMNPHFQVNMSDLMLQLPSAAIVLWLIAIYVAILLEGRLLTGEMTTDKAKVPSLRPQLGLLRLPDAVVWIFIASLLGAFGGFAPHAIEALSVNVMNVCVLLFFFQGIAVVVKGFEALRVAGLWQIVGLVIAVVYLSLFVSLLGLLDFWLDFRTRLSKRAESFNREA
jgi:hypothetical protein